MDDGVVPAAADADDLTGPDRVRPDRPIGPAVALAGIVLAFVVLASVIALRTPAWESADEPSHVRNIEALVAGHWYGMAAACHWTAHGPVDCQGVEAGQAPLYYLILAGWQRVAGVAPRETIDPGTSTFGYASGGPPELFLRHSASDHRFLLWLRLPNVVLGALTVLVTGLVARLVTSDAWTPVVAAALAAFLPRMVFLSAFVTNDNLVNLLGALLALTSLRFLRRPTVWRMSVVGLVCGLLVTTKLSTLPVVVMPVVLAGLVAHRRRAVALATTGICTALISSGWYLVQNQVRYGDPLARSATVQYVNHVAGLGVRLSAHALYFPVYTVTDPVNLVFVLVPERILQSLWYESGWNQFHWNWEVITLFGVLSVAALAGLYGHGVSKVFLVTLGAISVAGFASVWGVAFQAATYQARYALVALSALATLTALGVERWPLPIRFALPALGLIGTVVAIQQDVLAVHWT